MTEPLSSSAENGKASHGRLSPQDQRIFEHWQRVFSFSPLFAAEDHPQRSVYTPKDKTPPEPTVTIAPGPHSKSDLVQEADVQRNENQHKGCINLISRLFEKSPIIIFINSELKKIGCSPPIYCAPCPQPVHGGFHPAMGITICENHIPSVRRMESTLTHEMVHAFDHCRFKFDYNNLKHIACGEVRAVALSRECRFLDELKYHLQARWHGVEDEFGFNRRMQQCVKRRAVASLMTHSLKPTKEEAKRVVDQVFTSCFRDTRPFDELY